MLVFRQACLPEQAVAPQGVVLAVRMVQKAGYLVRLAGYTIIWIYSYNETELSVGHEGNSIQGMCSDAT